jgi:hypothetical protein
LHVIDSVKYYLFPSQRFILILIVDKSILAPSNASEHTRLRSPSLSLSLTRSLRANLYRSESFLQNNNNKVSNHCKQIEINEWPDKKLVYPILSLTINILFNIILVLLALNSTINLLQTLTNL